MSLYLSNLKASLYSSHPGTVFIYSSCGIIPILSFYTVLMSSKLTRKQIKEGLDQVPIDVLLTGTKNRRLTAKQKEFAKNLALGDTGADAYRKAYRKGKPPLKAKTIGNKASELKQNEGIQLEVEAIKRAIEFNKSHSLAQLRALVVSQLTKEALAEGNPPASRLTALKALGEVAGVDAFVHRTETKVIRDSDSARSELMEQLKKAIADNMRTVDSESNDAESLLAELVSSPIEIKDESDSESQAIELVATPPEGSPQDLDDADHAILHSIPHK